ncbi:MAG TPA: alpha/beta hydrolase, partial [Acidimicrobiales bacterium]
PWRGAPQVERVDVDGISALVWGDRSQAPLVLLHGGAQNAHTWDTVALALDRPVVAVDLPGHGHSAWRDDHDYRPSVMAPAIARAVDELAPDAAAVVGMSLGGLTALALTATRPDLVRRLALVDITPGVNAEKAADVHAFVDGPEYFADFDEILTRTVQFNPSRSEASLRRGILHNAHELPDGRWSWRYDRFRAEPIDSAGFDMGSLWSTLGDTTAPVLLLRGSSSPVVDDADVAELQRLQPDAQVVLIDGAGHSIQGDRPVELATHLGTFANS